MKNWSKNNRIIAWVIAGLVVIFGIYMILPAKDHFGYKKPTTVALVTQVSYNGINGQNALEILERTHNVQVKHYSFGDLVVSIDGDTPDSSHTWSFYVNGQLASVGAGSYNTKNSDKIMWRVDSIN